MNFLIGDKIDKYTVIEILGEEAWPLYTNQRNLLYTFFALKVCKLKHGKIYERLFEGCINKLNHPNIVSWLTSFVSTLFLHLSWNVEGVSMDVMSKMKFLSKSKRLSFFKLLMLSNMPITAALFTETQSPPISWSPPSTEHSFPRSVTLSPNLMPTSTILHGQAISAKFCPYVLEQIEMQRSRSSKRYFADGCHLPWTSLTIWLFMAKILLSF